MVADLAVHEDELMKTLKVQIVFKKKKVESFRSPRHTE